jgi:hypothetical protein
LGLRLALGATYLSRHYLSVVRGQLSVAGD